MVRGQDHERRYFQRLNPFFYRSSVGHPVAPYPRRMKRLNPFFYRSSVGRESSDTTLDYLRLNPFFYRSSVGPNEDTDNDLRHMS